MKKNGPREIRNGILAAIGSQDESYLQRIYDEYYPSTYRYVLCRVEGNHNEAEEIVEDIFFSAFRDAEGYDGRRPFHSWLLGIARHRIADFFRKNKRRQTVELAFSRLDAQFLDRLVDLETAEFPEDILEKAEMGKFVELVLSALPPVYEDLLRMRYMDEIPVKGLAERIGAGHKATESMLYRAREAFKESFRLAHKNLEGMEVCL